MWHTYDQRMYMISMNIHECGHVSFDFVLCACWIVVIRRTLFSLKWDSSKCCRGNMRHVMTWIKSWSNHLTNRYHTSMWFTSMYMTSQFYFRPNTSPTLVHQVMPHFRIKWCIHFVFPFFSVTLRVSTMAMLQVQPDLQALFEPILQTQRELARAHEIICQVDDLSDYTDDNHLREASLHLLQVRQRLRAVITHLKLRLTIQMIQLARLFRNHFRQTNALPIVNLDFR